MRPLVIDASVAVKWYLPEEDSDKALALLGSERALHAPDLLRIELANAFWRHVQQGEIDDRIWTSTRPQLERSFRQWHDSGELLDEAFDLACAMRHPIYDCVYLALAHRLGARLITADRRLLTRLKEVGPMDLALALGDFEGEQ